MRTLLIGTVIVVGVTVASGVVQGMRSNRWGPSDTLLQAGARIKKVPQEFGAWEMAKDDKMDDAAFNVLQPAGYIQRLYFNRDSGEAIRVIVLVGKSGPLSVHTPEICLAGQDHQPQGPRQAITIPNATGGAETVWKTAFRMKGIDAQELDVYYAWSPGGHWSATESPRFAYATTPVLYKLQLSSQVHSGSTGNACDPAIQFLTDFLPVLQQYLLSSSS
jgi:hypothetical protein